MLSVLFLLAAAGTAAFMFDPFGSSDDYTAPDNDIPPEDEEPTPDNNGTLLNDILTGTDGDNDLNGLAGDDTVSGLDGNDTLRGGAGEGDVLNGGNGDDLLIDGTINSDCTERVVGAGASVLNVTYEDGGDLYGEGGNDTILVTDGDGFGSDGDDSLSNWDVRLLGEIADGGYDPVEDRTIPGPSQISPGLAQQNNNLYGGDGNDMITSAQGNAFGEAGNDTIFGYGADAAEDALDAPQTSANFILSGGEGDDELHSYANDVYGDGGNDVLNGVFSNLYGGDGDDTLHTNQGPLDDNDSLIYDGGNGDDVFTASNPEAGFEFGGPIRETYIGGEGDEFIDARGYGYRTEVDPGEGADTIFADARNSISEDDSFDSFGRFEIADFDSAEDRLIVDVGVEPVTDGTLPTDPVALNVQLIDRSDADGAATELRLTLPDTSDVTLFESNELDTDARYILLTGVTPAEVDLDSVFVRAIFGGQVLSQPGFPTLSEDPNAPDSPADYVAPQTGVIAPLPV